MKLAVHKNHLGGQIVYKSVFKKRRHYGFWAQLLRSEFYDKILSFFIDFQIIVTYEIYRFFLEKFYSRKFVFTAGNIRLKDKKNSKPEVKTFSSISG